MQILVRLDQRQRLKADVNQEELNSRIRLRLFDKLKSEKKLPQTGDAAGVSLGWAQYLEHRAKHPTSLKQ
jgi:hypothetical protein